MRARSLLTVLAVTAAALGVVACGWDPKRPFEREAPQVKEAVVLLHDAGEAGAAATTLEEYLSTGPCAEGNIGTPERLRQRPSGAFDLGLALFKIGEAFGRRFGEEEADGGADENLQKLRRANVDCALRVVRAMAEGADGPDHPTELRARAHYLEGNLNFLDGQYEEAVKAYDKAIALSPGQVDAGDPVGRDAAWNRAIALRRIEDKKDAGSDASSDGGADGSRDAAGEGGGGDSGQNPDSGKDKDDKDAGGNPPSAPDGGNENDAASPPDKPDGGAPPSEPDGGSKPPPPPRANQDERILDQLESAPTLQQEAAKNAAGKRRVRGMADK